MRLLWITTISVVTWSVSCWTWPGQHGGVIQDLEVDGDAILFLKGLDDLVDEELLLRGGLNRREEKTRLFEGPATGTSTSFSTTFSTSFSTTTVCSTSFSTSFSTSTTTVSLTIFFHFDSYGGRLGASGDRNDDQQ